MKDERKKFDTAVPCGRWQEAPWGRLRYAVAGGADLGRPHRDRAALRCSISGAATAVTRGAPRRTRPPGHRRLDYAPGMLATAARRADEAGVGDAHHPASSRCRRAAEDLADGGFDLVLCHGVLPYPGTEGTLSVALGAPAIGRSGVGDRDDEPSSRCRRRSRTMDPEAVLAALDADGVHSEMFASELRLHRRGGRRRAPRAGLREVHHYGIGCSATTSPTTPVRPRLLRAPGAPGGSRRPGATRTGLRHGCCCHLISRKGS